jgi:hypothetical protein
MNPGDKKAFALMLAGSWAMYGKDVTPAMLEMFWNALQAYQIDDLRRAFGLHATDPDQGQFAPKPADLIRHMRGDTGSQAAVAWGKVERAVRMVGGDKTVVFDDPIIQQVLCDMGGWIDLCGTTEQEMSFKRNRFVTLYRGYSTRGGVTSWPARLAGRIEAENSAKGYLAHVPEPTLIGDVRSAQLVLEKGGDAAGFTATPLSLADLAAPALRLAGNGEVG